MSKLTCIKFTLIKIWVYKSEREKLQPKYSVSVQHCMHILHSKDRVRPPGSPKI